MSVPFTWECILCNKNNAFGTTTCLACLAPKPAADAPAADAPADAAPVFTSDDFRAIVARLNRKKFTGTELVQGLELMEWREHQLFNLPESNPVRASVKPALAVMQKRKLTAKFEYSWSATCGECATVMRSGGPVKVTGKELTTLVPFVYGTCNAEDCNRMNDLFDFTVEVVCGDCFTVLRKQTDWYNREGDIRKFYRKPVDAIRLCEHCAAC